MRNGENIGRRTHRGPIVQGTQKVVEQEMRNIWKLMRGEDGAQMRQRVIDFNRAMREDYRNGAARQAMEGFSDFMSR